MDTVTRGRPTRAEIEPAALELIRRYGAQLMSTARRYSLSAEDAEDAYQRGLEILLTKAPSTRESDLLPWLKTVVKHEAFAIRKQRERHAVPTDHEDLAPAPSHEADTHEQIERRRRLEVGAEAMRRLKPQEVRCLVLLAEGYSYAQIQEITGFSYTKVNRCLAEGRKSFAARVNGIESGAECERLAPLLSRFADREAGIDDAATVRHHLRGCIACRRSLREAREAPARVAALAPAGLVAAAAHSGGGVHPFHALSQWLHGKATAAFIRSQDAIELAMSHKAAAAAASAAIAGGGVATMETTVLHHGTHHVRHVHLPRAHPPLPAHVRATPPVTAQSVATRPRRTRRRHVVHAAATRAQAPPPQTRPAERPVTSPPPAAAPEAPRRSEPKPAPRGDGGGEFGP